MKNEGETTAEQYSDAKIDGALALARTMEQPGGNVVVVVSAGLFEFPPATARHLLLHEAQHVRMIQHGDSACAVHRRLSFEIPRAEITSEILGLAESAIDEFRAERGIHERGLGASDNNVDAGGLEGIDDVFQATRQNYRLSGDLSRAFRDVMLALERLALHLAYGAALVITSQVSLTHWAQVPPWSG